MMGEALQNKGSYCMGRKCGQGGSYFTVKPITLSIAEVCLTPLPPTLISLNLYIHWKIKRQTSGIGDLKPFCDFFFKFYFLSSVKFCSALANQSAFRTFVVNGYTPGLQREQQLQLLKCMKGWSGSAAFWKALHFPTLFVLTSSSLFSILRGRWRNFPWGVQEVCKCDSSEYSFVVVVAGVQLDFNDSVILDWKQKEADSIPPLAAPMFAYLGMALSSVIIL